MLTVSSIFEAYLHFQPYDPSRDSETVVIHAAYRNGTKTTFLSWDKGNRSFTVDDHKGNVSGFPGPHINRMGKRRREFITPDPAPKGATIQ